ncbi:MAG TPA: hypothetical protein PL009_09135 [Flavipsychrobacter sp.]|nr:hypothetical protein [Flavipsychrobacter sp.]
MVGGGWKGWMLLEGVGKVGGGWKGWMLLERLDVVGGGWKGWMLLEWLRIFKQRFPTISNSSNTEGFPTPMIFQLCQPRRSSNYIQQRRFPTISNTEGFKLYPTLPTP